MPSALSSLRLPPVEVAAGLSRARVVTIGDVMLDRTVIGDVARISPEAPIPVFRVTGNADVLGGAGNVLANAAALGARARLVAVVGDDDGAAVIRHLVAGAGRGAKGDDLVVDPSRATTVKERFVCGGQQILRADREAADGLDGAAAEALAERARAACADSEVVVLSDYRKGVVTPALARAVIDAARRAGAPVLVDPKGEDYTLYSGAFLLTPNAQELAKATRMPTGTDEQVVAACRRLIETCDLGGVLATRSEKGMTLVLRDGAPVHLRAESHEVFDITGAGDTVMATLAAALAAGHAPAAAAEIANVAAGIVVRKRGTATVSPAELVRALAAHAANPPVAKLVENTAELAARRDTCREMGLSVGFTNGCFDLLHPGHIAVLRQARDACDFLVVGLNSDASVRRLKGPTRPVQDERARATMLAALGLVDAVVVFEEDTPEALVRSLRPDVLVKGADYTRETVVGGAFVESYGGRVVLAELVDGHSTSALIARSNGGDPAAGRASTPPR